MYIFHYTGPCVPVMQWTKKILSMLTERKENPTQESGLFGDLMEGEGG